MAVKKVELLVCDRCNCISTGNPEEKVPCMECGETMARVEFVRQPTPRALDGGDSADLQALSTPEVSSAFQGESTPAHRK